MAAPSSSSRRSAASSATVASLAGACSTPGQSTRTAPGPTIPPPPRAQSTSTRPRRSSASRAADAWRTKPDETAAIVAKGVGVTPEIAKHDMGDYDFVALKDQPGEDWLGSAGEPRRVADVLKRTADFLVEQKSIRSAPPLEAFRAGIDTTLIEQATKG